MMHSSKLNNKLPANPPSPLAEWHFTAIGTSWWIGLYDSVSNAELTQLQTQIAKIITQFDATYSRFRPDSLVSRMAQAAGTYPLPADGLPLLRLYRQLYEATNGLITPLIGRALSDAGYDAVYSLQPKPLQPVPAWDDVLHFTDTSVSLTQPALLDFGAAGKGYLVDIVADYLETQGIRQYCIDGSGDIRYRHDTLELSVGLEHPADPTLAIGVAELTNQSLCGSASNRRVWDNGNYHHILNPVSLTSTTTIIADWVIADSTMLADGLASALFFVEPEQLKAFNFSYVRLTADYTAQVSKSFAGQLFSG